MPPRSRSFGMMKDDRSGSWPCENARDRGYRAALTPLIWCYAPVWSKFLAIWAWQRPLPHRLSILSGCEAPQMSKSERIRPRSPRSAV
jgi:hypothetical protein